MNPGWGSLAGGPFSAAVDLANSSPDSGEWPQQSQMPETLSTFEHFLEPLAQYLQQTALQDNSIAHGGAAVSDSCQVLGVPWNSSLPPANSNGFLDANGLDPQAANTPTTYPLGPLETAAVPDYFPVVPQQQHHHQFQQQGFYDFLPNGATYSMQVDAGEQPPSEGRLQPSRGQTWTDGASIPRYHPSPAQSLHSASPDTSATPSPTYPLSTHPFAASGIYHFGGVVNNVAGAAPSPVTTRENSPSKRPHNVEARPHHKRLNNTAAAATPRRASAAATVGGTVNAEASSLAGNRTNGKRNKNDNDALNYTPGHHGKRRKSAPNLEQRNDNSKRSGDDDDDDDADADDDDDDADADDDDDADADDDGDEIETSDDAEGPRARARAHGNEDGNGNGTQTPASPSTKTQKQTRDRNRAAASRYRAKTQAASAKLEVEGRAAESLNRSLHAAVAGLREEVFALKNELLGHAGCADANIQRYLSNEAERACTGLQGNGRGAQGYGQAAQRK